MDLVEPLADLTSANFKASHRVLFGTHNRAQTGTIIAIVFQDLSRMGFNIEILLPVGRNRFLGLDLTNINGVFVTSRAYVTFHLELMT